MTLPARFLSCGAALVALTHVGWGQPASPWRAYKILDGLPEPGCASVTVSPQGNVLARHLRLPKVTRLDGYGVTVLPAPPAGAGRIHESPAGQLWAAANGLYEFREGDWVFHPVPEIAAESKAAAGPFSGVPFLPVRQGRVLFLLRDRLMALESPEPDNVTTEVLRLASQTGLGTFHGLTPARDGGVWISAARGLAKLPSPARQLTADSLWQEYALNETASFQLLREPREDPLGGVVALAESVPERESIVVQFDGQSWTPTRAGSERIRFTWVGPEQTLWAAATNALFVRRNDTAELTRHENTPARLVLDVATELGGSFWLATSDGLYRYAPPVWRTPAPLASLRGPIRGFAEDAEARLWFAAGNALHSLEGDRTRSFPFPESLRQRLQSTPKFLPVADDALLFEAEEQLWRFDLARGVYAAVPPNSSGARFRLLGVLNDQSVCVQRVVPDAPAEAPRLERLDGVQVKPLEIPPPSPTVGHLLLAVFQAQNGNLWLSGEHGVAVYRSGQWKVFTTAEASGPEGGTWFAEAADGRIWCATPEEVWRFDGRDWSLVRSGLDSINALLRARDGSVWVASNSGLHRWLNGDWVENGPAEGLPDAVVTSLWEDRRGRLWAGTSQGLCQQHPEADPDPPRTEILPPADTLIPEGGTITLSFSGQDKWKFTPRSRLLYSHRLDERDWSPFVDWSTATFSDLPPGRHFVQVRAMDRNGNIEPKPTQVIFAVALPWYREPRLLGIAGVGLAAALFFAAVALNRHLQLRRSYAEVERQVAERTRELEQRSRELLHSQKMNALGTLAAGIAHDFNNILSVIKGSAQIIEDNLNQPQKVRTRVERIQTVVEQGAGIVRAMLGFSRSSNETLEPCDLNAVLEDTITLLGDRFLRDLELRFDRASGLPQVPVVKDFAQQILLNFIFNAAESMPERKQIVLRTARLETLPPSLVLKPADAAGYVAVSVQDFGCGIPPENLSRVFEPFFTTKALSRHRGTGLGLSMAYDLAKRMHAGLAVESVVGQGSTFTLILPANAA